MDRVNSSNNELVDVSQSRILIIDDDPINCALLIDLLDVYDTVIVEMDPVKAIILYQQQIFDLVLLDINMPVMDGFAVMHRIKQMHQNISPPIIILTAMHRQDVCNNALIKGATDFIYKPFDTDEALNRINNVLASHLMKKSLLSMNQTLGNIVELRTKELIDSKLKVIQHLGFAAEYRDNETAAHTIRVGQYAQLIARNLGLAEKDIELIYHAAPLHDIGKIGIPDAILLKPSKFDADEWEVMKTHAKIGAQILENDDDPLIVLARSIALTHHEKWNGQGYPYGLSGEDIPIEGRIVMLADVYDALMMERPYKKPWTHEDSIQWITDESGKSFDPLIVEQFLLLADEFLSIRQLNHD